MKTVLIIFFLTVQSSYSGNTEIPATQQSFDTVQFYASNGRNWRIKTYAQDQDVHIWSLDPAIPDIVALAQSNTDKHYGDVLAKKVIIQTDEGTEGVRHQLQSQGLPAHLELPASGAVFWTPEGSQYRSKSTPR